MFFVSRLASTYIPVHFTTFKIYKRKNTQNNRAIYTFAISNTKLGKQKKNINFTINQRIFTQRKIEVLLCIEIESCRKLTSYKCTIQFTFIPLTNIHSRSSFSVRIPTLTQSQSHPFPILYTMLTYTYTQFKVQPHTPFQWVRDTQ